MVELDKPVQDIKGVGPKIASMMNKLNIFSIEDLIMHFPRLYEDRTNIKPINNLIDGEMASVIGEVSLIDRDRYTSSGKHVTRIILKNNSGYVVGVWYNQKFIKKNFKNGEKYMFFGKVSKIFTEIQIVNPEYEKVEEAVLKSIVPIYPSTKNLPQKTIRSVISRLISSQLNGMEDYIPMYIREKYSLCDIGSAFKNIHSPQSLNQVGAAERRIKFEELLMLQIGLMMDKKRCEEGRDGICYRICGDVSRFIDSLLFKLTNAQNRVLSDVLNDMKSSRPMNRLIQGDVGSGKTIIAVIALLNAVKNGYQGAMMAPTEILALQHYETFKQFYENWGINVEFISSQKTKKQKEDIKQRLSNGSIDIIVGTHAIIQDDVEFRNLGLVITDEQHRFGVRQRALLSQKGNNPDVLVMTATPIPRTMALFIYGDLDISVIDELPPNRQKIETYVVKPPLRRRMYNFVRNEVNNGRQAYVVCPLIEESENLDVESAVETAEKLKDEYLNGMNVGLLHGKMKPEEKDSIMMDFKEGRISILVSTTVIEVGINIPNASVMIIENADRFGLAQLHQLRGRVGRGEYKSYCILVSEMKSSIARERMKIMKELTDGFQIADRDMKLRGTGEFFGVRQHGLPELKMADIIQDADILRETNLLARELIWSGDINRSEFKILKAKVDKKFGKKQVEITLN